MIWEMNAKYYTTTQKGGYSRCLEGYPAGCELNVLPNCVGYACGRFNEVYSINTGFIGIKYARLNTTANKLIEKCKRVYPELIIGNIPKLYAMAIFDLPKHCGHVAIVEEIHENYIRISESSFNGPIYNERNMNMDELQSMGLLGFIYNPSVK